MSVPSFLNFIRGIRGISIPVFGGITELPFNISNLCWKKDWNCSCFSNTQNCLNWSKTRNC